jgi:NAD(P)-dependent dehydrogenase (short-subunit alcohol dehydrogenase family)
VGVAERFAGRRVAVAGDGPVAAATAELVREQGASEADPADCDVLVLALDERAETPFLELDDAAWAAALEANLTRPFLVAQEAARAMAARGGGTIVFVGSDLALRPVAGSSAYSAAKAGLHLLATTMALDLAPDVRVCCVASSDELEPAAVASAAAFCASDEASYVLGSTFHPSGIGPGR